MAESKLQEIKKSLSSWSLSTIKKPKITAPKFRKPKLKGFTTRKKASAEEADKTSVNCDPGVNESLLSNQPSCSHQVIHDPRDEAGTSDQPYIIITVHDGTSAPSNETTEHKSVAAEDVKSEHENDIKNKNDVLKSDTETGYSNEHESTSNEEGTEHEKELKDDNGNITEEKLFENPPAKDDKTSSKGFKSDKMDKIRFIDDGPEDDQLPKNEYSCAINLNISTEEYYSWFDAEGTHSSVDIINVNSGTEEDYANYRASEYFDAQTGSKTITPTSGKSYESVAIPTENMAVPGSAKAREWVKSFNEDASKRAEASMKTDLEMQEDLPRSQSEVQLSNVEQKWAKKKEIVLNANDQKSGKNLFSKIFAKENKKMKDKGDTSNSNENIEHLRKESIKKIFGVRGKLSLRTPIIDTKSSSYKETDIYIASKPFSLTNASTFLKKVLAPKKSVESVEDGILDTSDDQANKDKEINKTVDDTEELLKEIENYLSESDGEPSKSPQPGNLSETEIFNKGLQECPVLNEADDTVLKSHSTNIVLDEVNATSALELSMPNFVVPIINDSVSCAKEEQSSSICNAADMDMGSEISKLVLESSLPNLDYNNSTLESNDLENATPDDQNTSSKVYLSKEENISNCDSNVIFSKETDTVKDSLVTQNTDINILTNEDSNINSTGSQQICSKSLNDNVEALTDVLNNMENKKISVLASLPISHEYLELNIQQEKLLPDKAKSLKTKIPATFEETLNENMSSLDYSDKTSIETDINISITGRTSPVPGETDLKIEGKNDNLDLYSEAVQTEEQPTNIEKKRIRPGVYISKTLKNIKESIFSPGMKGRLSSKYEKPKKTFKIGPFLRGKKKDAFTSEKATNPNKFMEVNSFDETVENEDMSFQECSFVEENSDEEQERNPNITYFGKSNNTTEAHAFSLNSEDKNDKNIKAQLNKEDEDHGKTTTDNGNVQTTPNELSICILPLAETIENHDFQRIPNYSKTEENMDNIEVSSHVKNQSEDKDRLQSADDKDNNRNTIFEKNKDEFVPSDSVSDTVSTKCEHAADLQLNNLIKLPDQKVDDKFDKQTVIEKDAAITNAEACNKQEMVTTMNNESDTENKQSTVTNVGSDIDSNYHKGQRDETLVYHEISVDEDSVRNTLSETAVDAESIKENKTMFNPSKSKTAVENSDNIDNNIVKNYAKVDLENITDNSSQITTGSNNTVVPVVENDICPNKRIMTVSIEDGQETDFTNAAEEEFKLYENEILSQDGLKTNTADTVLDNEQHRKSIACLPSIETPVEQKAANESKTLPRPVPRTKKNKYNQLKYTENKLPINNVTLDTNLTNGDSSYYEKDNLNTCIAKKVKIENINISNNLDKIDNNNGLKNSEPTFDSYFGKSNSKTEPIYWEIGDGSSLPKATPRKKKEKHSIIDEDIKHISNTSRSKQNINSNSNASKNLNLPEWIQQRPPIPSPRVRKPRSTQSLVQESSLSSKVNFRGPNVFGSCVTNLNFEDPKSRLDNQWSGEDFYSGKAASIAYGVTSFRSPQNIPREISQPPTIPERNKKPSLISLPGAVHASEEGVKIKYQGKLEVRNRKRSNEKNIMQKRIRRLTTPALPHMGNPRQVNLGLGSPLQVLEENLKYIMEVITSLGGRFVQTKPEDLLADVLFSVTSIMGSNVTHTWSVAPSGGEEDQDVATLAQIRSHLKDVFQVTAEDFEYVLSSVLKKGAAIMTLTLRIIEASDLRPQTVRGGSNPYVTVCIPGTSESRRSRTEKETLAPKWKQEFNLKVKDLNSDVLKLEIWHDFEASVSSEVLAVKDLKGFSRLMRETSAIAHKQEAHLLGTVTVPLKSIRENGLNEWFPLVKANHKDDDKPRGFLHIEGFVTAASQDFSPSEARKSHDSLLARLIFHHLKAVSNNNSEETFLIPWQGKLPSEAKAVIAQHAIILGLSPAVQDLSWWLVASRIPSAHAGWQLNLLKTVQKHLTAGVYDVTDIESLADSFAFWIECSLARLRNMRKSFPPNSGIIAKNQFSLLLAIFSELENHKQSNSLLERKEISDLRKQIKEAVTQHAELWWNHLVEETLRDEMRPEAQIQKVIVISAEAYNFLSDVATFYSPTLVKDMGIAYFREMFLLLTNKINPCVRPPLMNIYNHLSDLPAPSPADFDADRKAPAYTLEDGTSLWQLYVNLGRIYRLADDLPCEVRKESGLHEYHKWFNRGVRRWVELARNRAMQMIERAVELDSFEPVDEYCNFSSSATDLSGIFTDVQIWWRKLEWPDPENSMILLAKILEDVCSYGMRYADLLKQKVEAMFSDQGHSDQLVISKQICTGLNNIEKIRDELLRLPDTFGIKFLLENVKNSQTGGEEVSGRFSSNIDNLVEHSSENMERKVIEFIEAVIQKISGTLHNVVVQACEESSEKPLLQQTLDPSLQVLHEKLSDGNFKRFAQILWEHLLQLFHVTVNKSTDKRKSYYFNGVYSILQASLKFFCPSEGIGLDIEVAKTQEYLDLIDLLECLRLSSESLISKYYSERLDEQNLLNVSPRGQLVVRAFFTKIGKLTVEVIMAKDMHVHLETGSLASKTSQLMHQTGQIDPYVKVQLVPSTWFPHIHEVKTKTVKNSDPAVFEDEAFEFDLRNDENGVSNGFILLTLKDYNLGRPNTFIGEAVILMSELEVVDSSCVHNVPNSYLKLTHPGIEFGYASLRALRLRPGDRVATAFLKKLQARLPETRRWAPGGAFSSDDERSGRSRSPSLLRKIRIS